MLIRNCYTTIRGAVHLVHLQVVCTSIYQITQKGDEGQIAFIPIANYTLVLPVTCVEGLNPRFMIGKPDFRYTPYC
jgi:hypothetical protein